MAEPPASAAHAHTPHPPSLRMRTPAHTRTRALTCVHLRAPHFWPPQPRHRVLCFHRRAPRACTRTSALSLARDRTRTPTFALAPRTGATAPAKATPASPLLDPCPPVAPNPVSPLPCWNPEPRSAFFWPLGNPGSFFYLS
jgi:hypothetical protein